MIKKKYKYQNHLFEQLHYNSQNLPQKPNNKNALCPAILVKLSNFVFYLPGPGNKVTIILIFPALCL
jgi:hypothetical protein